MSLGSQTRNVVLLEIWTQASANCWRESGDAPCCGMRLPLLVAATLPMARGRDDYKPGPDSCRRRAWPRCPDQDDLPACIDRTRPASFIQASIKSVTPKLQPPPSPTLMPLSIWFLLFLAGFAGGFIDSIAGGGWAGDGAGACWPWGLPPQVAWAPTSSSPPLAP